MKTPRKMWTFSASSLAATLLLASCATTTSPTELTRAAASGATTVEAVSSAMRGGVLYDYIPRYSNDEVAESADVVASGVIDGIQNGPAYGRFDDEMADMNSVVLAISANKVVKGDAAEGDLLHVVLLSSALTDLDDWNSAFPRGTGVAVYLEKMSSAPPADPESAGIDVRGLDAFAGVDLYRTGPQEFAVQTENDTILWPSTGVVRHGAIEEALPGGSALGVLTLEEASRIVPETD